MDTLCCIEASVLLYIFYIPKINHLKILCIEFSVQNLHHY